MELKILSAGAVKTGVAKMAKAYTRDRGTDVEVEFTTAPGVRDRVLAGESPDVVIAPPVFLDELLEAGYIIPDSRVLLGRARMGVVVHADSPIRDVPDVESLKRMLSSASAVVRNMTSSGLYVVKLLHKLALAQRVGRRAIGGGSGAGGMA